MNKNIKQYPITYGMILLCVTVYVITSFLYGLEMNAYEGIQVGAFNGQIVSYYSEYWRLLSANFLHFGLMHIVVNCYSLYNVGMISEEIFGKRDYLIICMISALSTNLIPYLLYLYNGYDAGTVSAGISGVIFGIIGSLLALVHEQRELKDIFQPLFINVAIMILISVIVPNISLSGHMSGLAGGFFSALLILKYRKKKKNHLLN